MNPRTRLVITILFGRLGVHKFIDKKPLQGLLYIFTSGLSVFGWIIDIVVSILLLKKKQIDEIENTSKTLGIAFAVISFLYGFGSSSIGTEDFSIDSFIIRLVSGIAILKIFVIGNKTPNYFTGKFYDKNNIINIILDKYRALKTPNYFTRKFYDKNNIINTILDKYRALKTPNYFTRKFYDKNNIINIILDKYRALKTPNYFTRKFYDKNNIINIALDKYRALKTPNYFTGKFYDENNIILDKYRILKTPNYILIQINEQLHPTKNTYFSDDMIELSNKFKDKYLNNADFFPFDSYWAQIRDLNKYQLKWYLYWRKEFLNNNILDTDISYIFIFAYELICYTFNSKASFNISALERLYNSYKDLYPKLTNYLPEWIDDMLSEVGYNYNVNDIKKIEEDSLVKFLTTINELDKTSISTWRKHYSEDKSDLTNKQLTLLHGNQKFNNKFKKYAGLLAKYYIDNKMDIIQRWFEIKVITEKKRLFEGVPCTLQRRECTYKYKRYFSNSTFDHDMNQITRLCYDLIYPQNGKNGSDYVISQYENGRYELPKEFFYSYLKTKGKIIENKDSKKNEEKREFSIDITKIDNNSTKISYIENNKEIINFDEAEKEFIDKFENNILNKKEAQQYCVKKGKMLNAYITSLNEKYFRIIHKEIIVVEDNILRLNVEMVGNDDDR